MASALFWEMLRPAERSVLLSIGVRHGHPAGTTLLREGEPAASVLVLLSGRVKVIATGASGAQGLLAIRAPGDVLGELAAVDEGMRSATVVAVDPIDVLRLPVARFQEILRTEAGVAYALLRTLSTKLRLADRRRVELSEPTNRRIATLLSELAVDHGVIDAGAITISLPVSQDDLAMMIGASREAVVRALRELRSDGVLSTGRQQIVVLLPEELADRARGLR